MTSVLNFLYELVVVPLAWAQPDPMTPPASCDFRFGGLALPPGGMWFCIPAYISMVTGVVIGFCASICLVRLIVAGFKYMLGPATGGSTDDAKKDIINALLGLAVCLLTYIIIETVVTYVTSPAP
jgi:hypothetical protein